MPDDNADNPYAPPEVVEDEPIVVRTKPSTFFVVLHILLLVMLTPVLLIYQTGLFFLNFLVGYEYSAIFVLYIAIAIVFMVTYCGMIFRKVWGFGLCAIYACWWIVQPWIVEENSILMNNTSPYDVFCFVTYLLLDSCYAVVIYWATILLMSLTLLFLSLKHHRNTGRLRRSG